MDAASAHRRAEWLTLAALAAPWLLLMQRLRFFWTLDKQYAYGWSVPLLGAALFYFRWRSRPPVRWQEAAVRGWPLVCAAFSLLPLCLLQEAAPDWSVANWLLALAVAAFSLSLTAFAGGRDFARWFAFPTLFLLTALPWPQRFELWITGNLMRFVAACAVEVLGWLSIPALRAGNLIQLPAGVLGVNEACSGVRSLQALVMVTLFLGEIFRLGRWSRVRLCLIGFALALTGNLVRTLGLAWIAARHGIEAVARWHDPAGLTVLMFALGGTLLVALRMRVAGDAPGALAPADRPRAMAPRVAVLFLLWFGAIEGAVELWYRIHETGRRSWDWAIRWPEQRAGFRVLAVPPRARRILLCDQGLGAQWDEEDGRRWILYWLRWEPGRTATPSARMHRPETCLPAGGAILQQDLGVRRLPVGSLVLPFHLFTFTEGSTLMHVFFCLDDQANRDMPGTGFVQNWARVGLVQRAVAGQRNLGQQSLEAALIGYASPEAATRAFATRLQEVVVPLR